MRTGVLSFALRAAGAKGVAFQEFARWMSPWGWSRRGPSPLLRELREEGLTELTEDSDGPDGEILALRLTQRGEREMASRISRRDAGPRSPPKGGHQTSLGPDRKGRGRRR